MKETTAFILRFADYTVVESGCWEATVSYHKRPRAHIGGKNMLLARLICFAEHGDPPNDKCQAAHNCHNRCCVNPDHIEWQSRERNNADQSEESIRKRLAGSKAGAQASYEASGKKLPKGIYYREGRGYIARIFAEGRSRWGGPYGTLSSAVKWLESQRA